MGLRYRSDQLVFLDETSVDKRTTIRRRGWAPVGQRSRTSEPFVRGQRWVSFLSHFFAKSLQPDFNFRYSVLPALSLDGVLAVDIVEGSYDTEAFSDFVEGLLDRMQPFPLPNSVIVLDNCRIHKAQQIRDMIEARYVIFSSFLPHHSTWYWYIITWYT